MAEGNISDIKRPAIQNHKVWENTIFMPFSLCLPHLHETGQIEAGRFAFISSQPSPPRAMWSLWGKAT